MGNTCLVRTRSRYKDCGRCFCIMQTKRKQAYFLNHTHSQQRCCIHLILATCYGSASHLQTSLIKEKLYICICACVGVGVAGRWGRDVPPVQTCPGAHPASCKMGTGDLQYGAFRRLLYANMSSLPLSKPWPAHHSHSSSHLIQRHIPSVYYRVQPGYPINQTV